ncbi:MAG TPA: hypothetical protein VN751_13065 [Solirubrobacteraceae bacterium]|nr:hypothetical protein [Solirubrobacteraceae bacterium]
MPAADLDRARAFVLAAARLLDRHRFALRFDGGDPEAVAAALRPYANPDGGFGHALEPDLRGPDSQPEPTRHALAVLLDDLGRPDDPAVARACDFLAAASAPEGGVPFVLPSARAYPHAPWWQPADDPPPGLTTTGALAGLLLRHGIEHPWVPGATAFCWSAIEALEGSSPYELRGILEFLEHAPDRDRAARALDRVAPFVAEHVTLDPAEREGERHRPLDFAPHPGAPGRALFDDATIEANLDALAAAQRDDGGWTFDWPAWAPATEPEWRGWVTIRALETLAAYGRPPAAAERGAAASP